MRLFSFVLDHRRARLVGSVAAGYRRAFYSKGEVFEMRLPSRGTYRELEPPIPVEVLEGRIKGTMAKPIAGYVPKPGVTLRVPPGRPPLRTRPKTGLEAIPMSVTRSAATAFLCVSVLALACGPPRGRAAFAAAGPRIDAGAPVRAAVPLPADLEPDTAESRGRRHGDDQAAGRPAPSGPCHLGAKGPGRGAAGDCSTPAAAGPSIS
jgi:hypothetical protein